MRSTTLVSCLSSSRRPALVWCFTCFFSHGERTDLRLYLCQSQRLVKKFLCVLHLFFCFYWGRISHTVLLV
jgi:hypothetical protein